MCNKRAEQLYNHRNNIMTTVKVFANHLSSSKAFENKIAKLVPADSYIEVIEMGMQRASGYGSYYFYLEGELNGEVFNFKKHTNDSEIWDWYQSCETNRTFENWKKKKILKLLQEYLETI